MNFLQLKTNAHLKRNKALRTSTPYPQATTVAVVFTVEDKIKHDSIKEFVKKLEHDGKVVSVISFLPKKKENYEFLFDFFTEKDFNFWGSSTSHSLQDFSNKTFDYLFCLDTLPNPFMLNLLARSKAKCRVGRYMEENKPYFEFMIENEGGTKGLIEGIYRYTTLLR